jgi:hypothetical protein
MRLVNDIAVRVKRDGVNAGGPVPYEAMGQGGRALAQLAMPHGSSPARGHFRMLRSHARVDVGSLLVLFKRRPCRGPRITLGVTKSVI